MRYSARQKLVEFHECLSIYGYTVLLLDLGRFFSFLILYTIGRTPWTGDQPVAKLLPTHRTIETQYMHTDIQALSGIRTHDPSVRASEDSSCLRRRGHCDRFHGWILALISTSYSEYCSSDTRGTFCTRRVSEVCVPEQQLLPLQTLNRLSLGKRSTNQTKSPRLVETYAGNPAADPKVATDQLTR
jgi:hypothetical protein